MVALDYFSVFLIFYQFLIFHSAQALNQTQDSCPKEFQCGNLGKLSFPFSISSQPACGLYTIDCDVTPNPKIHLGEDVYTGLNQRAYDNSFRVLDLRLNDLLAKKSCHSFDRSLAFPSSPSISFRTNRNLTLFKCSNSSTNDHFFRGYEKYTKCRGFSIYYKYPSRRKKEGHSDAPQGDASDNCSQILLPIQRSSLSNTQKSGLFDFLTANFKLRWSLSDDCNKCYSQGGRCLTDSNNNFHCSANSRVAATSVGVIAVLVVLLLYLRTKYSLSMIYWKLTKREDYRNVKAFLKNHGSLLPRKYSFCEVKKMTQCLKNKLGQGGYGCVYKGKLHDGSLVAVKVLKESKGRGEEFINEVASISRTSHVNIVSLVGFCFEGRNRALLYDFMPNGSLEKFIYDAKFGANRQLGWQTLYDISLGIARGLEYLHRGCNTRILHFDIKPHNILLDEDFCPKISDFGLAKLCNKKESIVSLLGARGTIGYIAPEIVCKNIGGVSHKSDVYSYGMMVLEMVGGRKNIDVAVDHTSEIYFPYWIYTQIEQDLELGLTGIVKEEDKELAEKMILVSLWCIQTAPASRPSMSMVVDMLQGNLGSLQMPPKPFLYSPSRSDRDMPITTYMV
ncbi:LEAF RUST 10 DISEASE-RESISTANCE LOCUS RECEPTOR-LIKE PROTEIN KINASE-like 2.1 isoform X2 [Lycium barbarum]|uniref:LEAF RUST 10 DISEASE-RESISTANCE LOCUS RECEPTOR-LIKE PROTEIN KINASE-like 2.1 isoform X2 n=1 Tax=Lycium barbarum TaxID=112863 RepID=UPI00293E1837|nr:LEAF RUST 10 DISEASE-RESISTANCE LOCUS RECEPTOR-LIKE PROTEIN KINASE-like 2.1 isoform X2 [Lycium barbarum]